MTNITGRLGCVIIYRPSRLSHLRFSLVPRLRPRLLANLGTSKTDRWEVAMEAHGRYTRVAQSNGPQMQTDTGPHSSLLTIKRSARRSCYQSVDKSLKVFLRVNNLPGLEYRLHLAGYYTLGDLLSTNVELLCAGGITSLMARRLLNALDEYIQSQHGTGGRGEPAI